MTATGHALIGALIAAKFTNPYIALSLSFASHFACDILPHWDAGTHHGAKSKQRFLTEAVADVGISIVAAYLLYSFVSDKGDYLFLYLNVFAAQLPDWIMAPYLMFGSKKGLFEWSKWMYKLQHQMNSKLDRPWGIVTQIVAVILVYIFLFVIF